MALPKYTNQTSQTLKINHHALSIDADTMVIPSLLAMHTHPRHWGKEALTWQPSRWILSGNPNSEISNRSRSPIIDEELFVPPKGTYFPWSDGPQNCPGKKFSQVEFVAVIACLLQKHRVRPLYLEGESQESARERILRVCEDSELVLLLRMRNADSVKLVWEQE